MSDERPVGADEIRALFDGATAAIPVPAGDIAGVVRRGRTRRARSLAVAVTASAVAVAGAWGVVAAVDRGERGPSPVAQDPPERRYSLVPTEASARKPPGARSGGRAVEDARAVTVAFHALLHRVGYDLDYKNVVRRGGAWEVSFLERNEAQGHQARLQARLDALLATQADVSAHLDRLSDVQRRLRAQSRKMGRAVPGRARVVAGRSRAVARDVARLERIAADLESEVREVHARLEQPGTARFTRVVLRVVRSGPRLVVEAVEVVPSGEDAYDAVTGYAEEAAAVDVHGADYYDGTFEGPGPRGDSPGFDVRAFWTGPIPSPYEEQCVGTLVDFRGGGGEVWRQDPSGRFPPPPAIEDERDGWSVAYAIDYDGSLEGLDPVLQCSWRRSR